MISPSSRTRMLVGTAVLTASLITAVAPTERAAAVGTLVGVSAQPLAFGDAQTYGRVAIGSRYPLVGMAATPDGKGYRLAAADGGVFSYGDAGFFGSMGGRPLNAPVVGISSSPDGKGYWLVAADGGIFSFGDASWQGSMGAGNRSVSVVGMASAPDGKGYWLASADGSVFPFGDAGLFGSVSGSNLNASVVGMASTRDGKGYWLVAADGGVFAYGDAGFFGSVGSQQVFSPVVTVTPTPDGAGYWVLTSTPIAPAGVPVLGHPTPIGHDFWTEGFGLVEPTMIVVGVDPQGYLSGIEWGVWGGSEAIGTGLGVYVAPGQVAAEGSVETGTVVAFDLGTCDGQFMYQAFQWYFPQHGGSVDTDRYQNLCTGSY